MLENLKNIAMHNSVSGCEDEMLSFLFGECKKLGLVPETDENACLCVKKDAYKASDETLMISVSLDVPGYIALCIDGENAYLSSTGEIPFDFKKDLTLVSEEGALVTANKESDKKSELVIPSENVKLGDVFRLPLNAVKKKDKIEGYFVSKYANILLLLEWMKLDFPYHVLFVFISNSFTGATKLKNVARKYKPGAALSLGSIERDLSGPAVLLKDGSGFAKKDLLYSLLDVTENGSNYSFLTSADPVTQSDKVLSFEGVPFVSVALPYQRKKNGKEVISLSAYQLLKAILKLKD